MVHDGRREEPKPDALEELGTTHLLGHLGIKRDYTASAKKKKKAADLPRFVLPQRPRHLLCELGQMADLRRKNMPLWLLP